MQEIITEVKGEALTIVNSTNTAIAAQSGSLPVFGTPFMIALMEKATCNAVSVSVFIYFLSEGGSSLYGTLPIILAVLLF